MAYQLYETGEISLEKMMAMQQNNYDQIWPSQGQGTGFHRGGMSIDGKGGTSGQKEYDLATDPQDPNETG